MTGFHIALLAQAKLCRSTLPKIVLKFHAPMHSRQDKWPAKKTQNMCTQTMLQVVCMLCMLRRTSRQHDNNDETNLSTPNPSHQRLRQDQGGTRENMAVNALCATSASRCGSGTTSITQQSARSPHILEHVFQILFFLPDTCCMAFDARVGDKKKDRDRESRREKKKEKERK